MREDNFRQVAYLMETWPAAETQMNISINDLSVNLHIHHLI